MLTRTISQLVRHSLWPQRDIPERRWQQLVASGLGLTVVLGLAPPASALSDLSTHWSRACVQHLADQQQISGYPDGSFRPDRPLTRAEYAVLMLNSFPDRQAIAPSARPIPAFKDLPSRHWAYSTLRLAYQKQIFVGYPDSTIRPDQPITRVEAISILFNLASPNALSQQLPTASDIPNFPVPTQPQRVLAETFDDAGQAPTWAQPQLAGATAGFLVVDYPQGRRLRPQAATTRAEAAAMLCQVARRDGLVPYSAVAGYRHFHSSPALDTLRQAEAAGQIGWFDGSTERAVIAQAPTGWRVVAVRDTGAALVPAQFEQIGTDIHKYGFLNAAGEVVIPPQWAQVGELSAGYAWFQQEVSRRYGLITPAGEQRLLPPEVEDIQPVTEGLAAVRVDNLWGFIDAATGEMAIAPQFDAAAPFSEGLAQVRTVADRRNGLQSFGFIDRSGQIVLAAQYGLSDGPFSEGLAKVFEADLGSTVTYRSRYINRAGETVIPALPGTGQDFSEGLAAVQVVLPSSAAREFTQVHYGYIDRAGSWAIPPQSFWGTDSDYFYSASPFKDGLAVLQIGDRAGLIDRTGRSVIPPIYSAISTVENGYAYVNYGGVRVTYTEYYDGSATPYTNQSLVGGRWGYIKLPE